METRNILFHKGTGSGGSLGMMKTEVPSNGERQVLEEREHRHATATPDHGQNGSGRLADAVQAKPKSGHYFGDQA
jgi:hypothetical protein